MPLDGGEADVDDRTISDGKVHDSALTGLIARNLTLTAGAPRTDSRIKTQIDLSTDLLTNKLVYDIPLELIQSLEISDFQNTRSEPLSEGGMSLKIREICGIRHAYHAESQILYQKMSVQERHTG